MRGGRLHRHEGEGGGGGGGARTPRLVPLFFV